jgi:cytochrome c
MTAIRYIVLSGSFLTVLITSYWGSALPAGKSEQKNNAPVVRIVSPRPDGRFAWNTLIPYSIAVSDKEDGESKFGEITATEVFLEVHYFADPSKGAAYQQRRQQEAEAFTLIKKQDCFNCHTVRSKLIGPSFQEIGNKYKKSPDLVLLASHVIKGSSGIWGTAAMPTHPDLDEKEAQQIVRWILDSANDPNVDYLRGTEGSFWFRPPANASSKGVFVLKAGYTDHGIDNNPASCLAGHDVMLLRSDKTN